jgi:hypothetical protein
MVSKGIDPEEQAQARAVAELTVDDICDWYLSEAEAGRNVSMTLIQLFA